MNPAGTTAPITKSESAPQRHGHLILIKLIEIAPEMMTTRQLAAEIGLSLSQTYRGLVWVKEVGAAQEGRAYVHSRKHGHGFPGDLDKIEGHETVELSKARNIEFRLLLGTIAGHLQRYPDDRYAQWLNEQLEHAVKSVDIVIEEGRSRREARTTIAHS